MTEHPILFSAPMVRAILAGQKTQTRRIVKGAVGAFWDHASWSPRVEPERLVWTCDKHTHTMPLRCPFGAVGDQLWVKETIRIRARWHDGRRDICASYYPADDEPTPADGWPWKRDVLTAVHCPRGLSRITLEVTNVRVERLQEISEDDADDEGVDPYEWPGGPAFPSSVGAFHELWNRINSKRASWDSNPWVWVVSFKRVEAP